MTNTNTKQFMTKVQNTIINKFEWSQGRLTKQLQVFTYIYGDYNKAKELVTGGCFDCYYNNVAQTMSIWFDCTADDIWKYYKDDSQKMWNSYVHIMAKNIVKIVNGKIYL